MAANTYEQGSLFSSQSNTESSAAETFGCCSRYRNCSDTGVCLIPHLDYSKNCTYRKALEAGRIFYGKNANTFRNAVYQSFVDHYQALTPETAGLLCDIYYYSQIQKRGAKSIMLADVPGLSTLASAGFFRLEKHPAKVVKLCTFTAMLNACGDLIESANEWAKSREKPEKWNRRRTVKKELPSVKIYKDELADWIIQFSPETSEKLAEGICFVEFDLSNVLEIEEFFTDYLYREDYVPSLDICEKDPRFLSL